MIVCGRPGAAISDSEVGTSQLMIPSPFDGVPGDTKPGNNNYDLPVGTVNSGMVEIE